MSQPAFRASLLSAMTYAFRSAADRCDSATVGTSLMPSSFAAMTRPCPAMISQSSLTSTGLVNPNRVMLSAICRTCFFEWVRALPGYGRKLPVARCSICVSIVFMSALHHCGGRLLIGARTNLKIAIPDCAARSASARDSAVASHS